MEEKKAKGIEEDMISKLPDSLISQILLYLPTKEAVRTSVLSNRWRSLWLLIPGLNMNSCEFSDYNAFASFINKCLDFSKDDKSCLHKLKLSILKDENDKDMQPKLPRLLASCPNLRSLILDLINSYGVKQMRFLSMPLCLLSSLEFVEIKCKYMIYPIVELARYFAENSAILKKLVLCLGEENPLVLSDLLALPRRSSACQIIVC